MRESLSETAGSGAAGRPGATAGVNARLDLDRAWHALEPGESLTALGTRADGLDATEAARRLAIWGPNRLPRGPQRGILRRLAEQFHNLFIYVLMAAGVVAAALDHTVDALVIFAVVIANAVIGFVQEGRAEKALEAIRGLIDPRASVIRDGHRQTVPADQVVPGDIVLLEAGDRVPADLRLVRSRNLRIDEAILTGESVPVDKAIGPVDVAAPLGDRLCMAHSGTFVTAGQGTGVVIGTGAATELGRVSVMIGAVERLATPLVRQLDQFARQVTFAILGVSGLVFLYAAFAQAYAFDEAFMVVVGLAVAAIPEGLPAVMTITLAVGVQRMARRNAIIRRLPAVETLGAVSVICSDKTGTLTRNEMTVTAVVTADRRIVVEGVGYRPEGGFAVEGGEGVDPAADPVLEELTLAALLCNDAEIRRSGEEWIVDGDPMEGALVSLASKAGHDVTAARTGFVRRDEIPFDARHRYMATLNARDARRPVAYVKGAPERIVEMCAWAATQEGEALIDLDWWRRETERLGAEGRRVIAIARRTMPEQAGEIAPADVEGGLTLLGLVGLIDPPRPEAVAAVAECRSAGIRVKMITGDHASTARAIALQLGLAADPVAVTGQDLDGLDEAEFKRQAQVSTVFARTSPEHKLRLVEALQQDGSVIAMTGDGVNDAPALKRADVGVAMGQRGSDVSREVAHLVLLDDNFATIVTAIEEGRGIYENIQKFIRFLFSTNLALVLLVVGGAVGSYLMGLEDAGGGLLLPLTAVQLLWINIIADGPPALALGMDRNPGVMQQRPRNPQAPLLDPASLRFIVVTGVVKALMGGVLLVALPRYGLGLNATRSAVFLYESIAQLVFAYPSRRVSVLPLSVSAFLAKAGMRSFELG